MIRSLKRWLAWRRTMRLPDLSDQVATDELRRAFAAVPVGEVTPEVSTPWRPWEATQ